MKPAWEVSIKEGFENNNNNKKKTSTIIIFFYIKKTLPLSMKME
jgi:hypothetical protein